MKIAHVTSSLSRNGGGVQVVVEALSGAQSAAGAEVRAFGMLDSFWAAEDFARWQGAPATALPVVGPTALGYMPQLSRALCEFSPDIVHLHGLWMYPGHAVLRWHHVTGKPYMLSVHGMLSSVALGYGRLKKAAVRRLYQDAVFAEAHAIHATHPGEADEVRAFGLDNHLELLPLGVHVRTRPTHLPAEPTRRVLSLGRIHPKKGLDRLVDAWATLEPDFSGWSLDIVGPDEAGHADELRRRVGRAGLRRVSICPPVNGTQRDMCMAGAQLFVLPTRSDNFALTVAESLTMEVPVIATTGAPWGGLVEHGCGWWIPQGVEPLASALRQAMQLDDATRAQMGRRGRDWMRAAFGWPTLASRYVEAYARIMAVSKDDPLR